jgi:hypothetical protein
MNATLDVDESSHIGNPSQRKLKSCCAKDTVDQGMESTTAVIKNLMVERTTQLQRK